jgi:hypothetical protein
MAAGRFWFGDGCPANPVARIFKEAADDSPSPPTRVGGEGRGEVARKTKSNWGALRTPHSPFCT